jgi:tRNA (guanine-N7-)-methyltransferase
MAASLGKNSTSSMTSVNLLAKSESVLPSRARQLFGRRIGRPLSKSQAQALKSLLPVLAVPSEDLATPGALHPGTLFKTPPAQTWLEIGFGNGEHLDALLRQHPDTGFIGAEPFMNGMAAFLKCIEERPADNVRVLMDDALRLVDALTDQSIDRLYILNPDPWPKKRHHKRRIISQKNLSAFARILKPGALLVMATDVDDLAEWMVTESMIHPAFTWTARNAADWQTPPPGWIKTRYAAKGEKKGHRQTFLVFQRL